MLLLISTDIFSQKILEKALLKADYDTLTILKWVDITPEGKIVKTSQQFIIIKYKKCWLMKVTEGYNIYFVYVDYKQGKKLKKNHIYPGILYKNHIYPTRPIHSILK